MKKQDQQNEPKVNFEAPGPSSTASDERQLYLEACGFAEAGQYEDARVRYQNIERITTDASLKALVKNDLAALDAVEGKAEAALTGFEAALSVDNSCMSARSNLCTLQMHELIADTAPSTIASVDSSAPSVPMKQGRACRVAILSFLFNWPSRGGGIVHTVELTQFLIRAGYEVRHLHARNLLWGVGSVDQSLPIDSQPVGFDNSTWNRSDIQRAFRREVDRFDPDYVIITDCWNFKPYLAEAVRDYPFFLRQQALECLCPLNNLRLLVSDDGQVNQCPKHQLATPQACIDCVREHGAQSGKLHTAERTLSRVETSAYQEKLRWALEEAESVLVLNPLIAEMIGPHANSVQVVTWGMDPVRFPWPWPDESEQPSVTPVKTILMAGLVSELIKGFHVLHEACRQLREKRRDFRLTATGEPAGSVDEFTRFVGWLSQDELPKQMRQADILVMPTIAQEGLGRATVEAMAVGRPVVASRIGGLPYTVKDRATGLLFEPGNSAELAEKIECLLDDPELRQQMGMAGRRVFEEEFMWGKVIDRHYRPLFATRRAREPA